MIDLDGLLGVLRLVQTKPDQGQFAFTVRPLPGGANSGWIGRNNQCGAAFLLAVPPEGPGHPAVALPLIRVRHCVPVAIDDGQSRREVSVSLLECLARDDATVELFVRAVGGILTDRHGLPSAAYLGEIVERLLGLFRDYSYASDAGILGLWGELLLIAHCPSPERLARQWRSHEGSRYDFGSETERLDVKATTSPHRHHELSFGQVAPPAGVAAAFASISTEQVSQGTSVGALWDRVLSLAPNSQARIDSQCIRTLGRDWQKARETSFDLSKALTTLLVYPVSGVPRLADLPPGVLRARFTSDFSLGQAWEGAPPTPDGPIAAALACSKSHYR